MAPLILYYFPNSGPSRMALGAIRCLELDVEVRVIDLYKKEQFNPDFIKVNPHHKVPTLDDNGFIMTESRAIAVYLAEKYYPEGHSLYPRDPVSRAKINERLHFDCGTLYPSIREIQHGIIYSGQTTIFEEQRQRLFEALDKLSDFLQDNRYLTGSEVPTLADVITFVSISNVVEIGGDLSPYPNIDAWFERCKALPSAAETLAGAKALGAKIKECFKETLI